MQIIAGTFPNRRHGHGTRLPAVEGQQPLRNLPLEHLEESRFLDPLSLRSSQPVSRLLPLFQRRDFKRDPAGADFAGNVPVR